MIHHIEAPLRRMRRFLVEPLGLCIGMEGRFLVLPITFANENGSHGGVGSEETHAFALLPHDVLKH